MSSYGIGRQGGRLEELSYWLAAAATACLLLLPAVAEDAARAGRLALGLLLLALAAASFISGRTTDPVSAATEGRWRCALESSAVIAPLVLYIAWFSWRAYAAHFVGDYDFTSISEALNRSAALQGLLPTSFLATGNSSSYLAHHFSPGLLLLTPCYLAARMLDASAPEWLRLWQATHLAYALALLFVLGAGLLLWRRLALHWLATSRNANLFALSLSACWMLQRQALSFHFELLSFPLSAALFLSLQARCRALARGAAGIRSARRAAILYFSTLLLLLALKEDMGVYLSLWAVFLFLRRDAGASNSIAAATLLLSLGWHLLARLAIMPMLQGPHTLDWSGYWDARLWPGESDYSAAALAFFALGFAPFFSLRAALTIVVPLLLLHAASHQPWHHRFFGHYSYDVLPFLAFAALSGLARLREHEVIFRRPLLYAGGLANLGFCLLAAAADRYTPLPPPPVAANYQAVEAMLRPLQSGDCLQTQFPFSAHAPLAARVYPLVIPRENPAFAQLPQLEGQAVSERYARECRRYFLLLDATRPMAPYYSAEILRFWQRFAQGRLQLLQERGTLRLYGRRDSLRRIE
ncbi:MAG: DUF2079 domain-containing protein [Leptospirales bacterium]|nr:DUF2079 domain-containing protein [Leptospirales bacterium]